MRRVNNFSDHVEFIVFIVEGTKRTVFFYHFVFMKTYEGCFPLELFREIDDSIILF